MDTGSPAFLTRKVAPLARSPPSFARLNRLYPAPQIEILEKELADANARLALIDADVRPRPPLPPVFLSKMRFLEADALCRGRIGRESVEGRLSSACAYLATVQAANKSETKTV